MLFLTAICHQDYKVAGKMDFRDALGLQAAFGRFFEKLTGGQGKSSKDIQNLLASVPPPSEWRAT